jgi:hypothetical protein
MKIETEKERLSELASTITQEIEDVEAVLFTAKLRLVDLKHKSNFYIQTSEDAEVVGDTRKNLSKSLTYLKSAARFLKQITE